mgnify:CR=1 FL=1
MNQRGTVEKPPVGRHFEDNCENGKDVLKLVNMLSLVQVAGKYGFEI